MSNNKPSIDGKVPLSKTFKELKNGSNSQRAKALLNTAIASLLIYLGVEPKTAEKIAPWVLRILIVLAGFLFIVLIAVFANSTFSSEEPDYSEEYSEVNETAGRAARDAAIRYDNVPELLLLGIAKAQTDVGITSPYDSIDRSSIGNKPLIEPPIGSEKKSGEGLGPYLISQDQLRRYSENYNPNYWSDSTDLVASWIQETVERFDTQGVPLPDPDDFEAQDEYWIKVVSTLPLVDPLTQEEGCLVESDMPIAEMVKIVFECELEKHDIYVNEVSKGPGGTLVSRELSKKESIDIITNEALNFAYVWGSRGSILSWESVEEQYCDNDQKNAGVFPLTEDQAKKFGVDDRCDAEDNIEAAVKIFIENYENTKDSKNLYKAAAAGWLAFDKIMGVGADKEKFLESGKILEYNPAAACVETTTSWVSSVLKTNLGAAVSTYVNEKTESNYSAALEVFTKESEAARNSPHCVNTVNSAAPSAVEFLHYSSKVALGEAAELYENNGGVSDNFTTALSGLSELAKNTQSPLTPITPKWGETPVLDRLSSISVSMNASYIPTYFKPRDNYRLGVRAVAAAILLGGYRTGDPRAGTDILNDLLDSLGEEGSALFTGGFTMGIGIAIERENPNEKKLISKVDGSKLVKLKCGVDQSSPRWALPIVAQRWESMCQDAKADGVRLGINSAWRSMESQTALYNGQAPGEGRVAQPGSSPHQKGQALDLVLGTPWGSGKNQGAQYAWLHSIVGCIEPETYSFTSFDKPMLNTTYVRNLRNDNPPCNEDLMPVKRAQIYGFVFLCTHSPLSGPETWASPEAVVCETRERMPESPSGQIREPWHIDIGPIVAQAIVGGGAYSRIPGCDNPPEIDPSSRRSVAIGVKQIWYCELSKRGLANLPPKNGPGLYKGKKWFKNLADQVSSEAVLVAYCESSLTPSSAGGSYKGVFQMGPNEMRTFSKNPDRWMDAEENIRAAVKYWAYGYRAGGEGSGWRPWAVVNTSFYSESNPIQRPIIGRFKAKPPSPAAGEATGLPLPNWAISPSEYWGLSGSCKDSANNKVALPDGKYDPIEGAWTVEVADAAGSKSVLVIGDSLTVGSRNSLIRGLEKSGWNVQVVASQNDTILKARGKIKKVSRIPRLVVAALGTNDYARSEEEIVNYGKRFIKKLGPGKKVMWVNVFMDETKNQRYVGWEDVNIGLERLAEENSDTIRLFDWYNYATENDIETLSDGVHYSGENYTKRAQFIVNELNSLLSQPGFGDDRTAKQIKMAADAVSFALSQKGKPYVAGARGPRAYDCSGFTYTAWKKAGFKWSFMPSYMQRTYKKIRKVTPGTEQPGDLIFTDYNHSGEGVRGRKGPSGVDHVAMVLDPVKGTTIEANLSGGVSIGKYHSDGKYVSQFISIGRPSP